MVAHKLGIKNTRLSKFKSVIATPHLLQNSHSPDVQSGAKTCKRNSVKSFDTAHNTDQVLRCYSSGCGLCISIGNVGCYLHSFHAVSKLYVYGNKRENWCGCKNLVLWENLYLIFWLVSGGNSDKITHDRSESSRRMQLTVVVKSSQDLSFFV